MEKTVFVIDPFTNGHEAAEAFVKGQGWREDEYQFVFCGSNAKVLQRLAEGSAYAVLPVENSTVGEVEEVTRPLKAARDKGYAFKEIDRLVQQINHCLMAPHYVVRPEDLDRVLSHKVALGQCDQKLTSMGLTPEKRSRCDSTGGAAKAVARLAASNKKMKFGAIAPKEAAAKYGLRILAENIQDVPNNRTTFVFLENKADVFPVTVGIIGINGRFGQLLKRFFERLGCRVIGSDENKPTDLTNEKVVQWADVVIFSVPIKKTPSIVRSLLSYIKSGQLLMDVTSVKEPAVMAMLESQAQVVGLHPMFRPEMSFDGQTVVVCPARLTVSDWKTWVINVLTAMKAHIKWSDPPEHDKYMTVVQGGPHLGNLASAVLIAEEGISVTESLDFTSPFYRVMFSLMGRLLSQNPALYRSIAMENPQTAEMLRKRIAIEQQMLRMIEEKDEVAFDAMFAETAKHFGSKIVSDADELFVRILSVFNTLYGTNSVTLEFQMAQSQPGLLGKICAVFSERRVNLTGIHSVELGGQRLQFSLSFSEPRHSEGVRKALEEIEGWNEPKARIIA